jgi:hypothetical protein
MLAGKEMLLYYLRARVCLMVVGSFDVGGKV